MLQEVEPNSPASKAGLRAFTDYIVATDAILTERDDLLVVLAVLVLTVADLHRYLAATF